MQTDFKKLSETKHMLDWLSNDPYDEIIFTLESMFNKQSPGTSMLEFAVTSEPQWLTGGKKTEVDNKVILVRSGVAVTCDFVLQDGNGTYNLSGVLTWVGVHLDGTPKTNIWMDLDGTLEAFGKEGLLQQRIYELEDA